eukprot:COSAG06_NODE_577_length_14043_cov_5.505952_17_plen_466_part_00
MLDRQLRTGHTPPCASSTPRPPLPESWWEPLCAPDAVEKASAEFVQGQRGAQTFVVWINVEAPLASTPYSLIICEHQGGTGETSVLKAGCAAREDVPYSFDDTNTLQFQAESYCTHEVPEAVREHVLSLMETCAASLKASAACRCVRFPPGSLHETMQASHSHIGVAMAEPCVKSASMCSATDEGDQVLHDIVHAALANPGTLDEWKTELLSLRKLLLNVGRGLTGEHKQLLNRLHAAGEGASKLSGLRTADKVDGPSLPSPSTPPAQLRDAAGYVPSDIQDAVAEEIRMRSGSNALEQRPSVAMTDGTITSIQPAAQHQASYFMSPQSGNRFAQQPVATFNAAAATTAVPVQAQGGGASTGSLHQSIHMQCEQQQRGAPGGIDLTPLPAKQQASALPTPNYQPAAPHTAFPPAGKHPCGMCDLEDFFGDDQACSCDNFGQFSLPLIEMNEDEDIEAIVRDACAL